MPVNPATIRMLTNLIPAMGEASKEFGKVSRAVTASIRAITGAWIEMQDTAFKTARSMNMSRDAAMRYNRQLMASTRALAVQYGITAENIAEFQKNYATAVGRNILLTKQQTSQIAALGNITDEATAQSLLDEFDKIGVSIDNAFAGTVQIQERAKFLGLNGAKASKDLASNIKLASSYSFRNGVDDIQKMALKAQSLRMDMNAVMSAAEKFMDIESSISTAANIQMLGGSFAHNFSNPMAVMYESMADPNALMDRITKTIEGKGTYKRETGEVTFDPITMMQMREMAKNLGMSVEELTRPAAAKAQNAVVDEEIRRNANLAGLSAEQKEAIRNLSRTNVDRETGEHFITYIDENRELQQVKLSQLDEKQLKIAQDSQLTQDNMWKDIHDIRDFLLKTGDERARQTVSLKDELKGITQWFKGVTAGLEDSYMGPASNTMTSNKGVFGDTGDLRTLWNWTKNFLGFKSGGIVGQHFAGGGNAANGLSGIVNGRTWGIDKLWTWLTKGEMVLNQNQQKGLFSFIKSLGKDAFRINALNSIGGMVGMDNLGGMMMMKHLGMFGGGSSLANKNVVINGAKVTINGSVAGGLGGQVGYTRGTGNKKTKTLENVRNNAKKGKAAAAKAPVLSGTKNALAGKSVSGLRRIASAKQMIGTAGKAFGKSIPWIGGALAIGSLGVGLTSANKGFNERKEAIDKMGLSDLSKAKELDKAVKERNKGRGGAVGSAVGAGIGMALGSVVGPLGTMVGGFLGERLGNFVGKGIGGLFGGKNEEAYRRANMPSLAETDISGKTGTEMLKVLNQINGRFDTGIKINPETMKTLTLSLPTIGIKPNVESPVVPKPTSGNSMYVAPVDALAARTPNTIDVAPKNINLNVSGTIRLESNGSSANIDVEKLLESSEFVSQLTEVIKKRMNEMSNSSKVRGESYFSL